MNIVKRLLFLSILISASSADGEIVDGMAAEMDGTIITISDVRREAKIRKIIDTETPAVSFPVKALFSVEVLEQMINREIMYQEAKRLKTVENDVDIVDEMLALEGKFASRNDFDRFLEMEGLAIEDLAERFLKEKSASSFVKKRLLQKSTSLRAAITEQEIEEYYRNNIVSFEGKEMKAVKELVINNILKERIDQALEEWLFNLRERARIRYFKVPLSQHQHRHP